MKVTIRRKKLKKGNYSYYLDIYHQGQRRYEYLGMYTSRDKEYNKELKKLAEQIRNKKELELQSNNYNFIPEFKRRTSVIKYLQNIADSKADANLEMNTLVHLKKYTRGDITFQEIDEVWLEKFKKYLVKKVSSNSALLYFRVIKTIFKQAQREKIIQNNPANNVSNFKYIPPKIAFVEQDELQKLSNTECSNADVKRAFLFACFTGLRRSDIIELKWGDVNDEQLEVRQKKTNELLYLPLSSTAMKLLKNGDDNVIHLPDNQIFKLPSKTHTNRVLQKWFDVAEIKKDAHFHISRHTFATLSLTAGVDLYTVSKLLGHKNFKNTQIYANIIDEKKKKAVDSLPNIDVS